MQSEGKTAIVVLGGNPPTRAIKPHIPPHRLVIAADSGLHGAIDLGLKVNLVIGDMDSVDKAVLAAVEANGTTVTQLPRDKDSTDAELALLKAAEMGAPKYMELYGAFGLLVTLIWLYLEILKLLSKLNSRD